VRSIAGIIERVAQRARETPPGDWIRGWGYEPFYLAEHRHPTRLDLDRATAQHPVILHHRTRHAFALNSQALRRLGLAEDVPEPPGTIFERALPSGDLTGVVLGTPEAILRRIPAHAERDVERAASEANLRLLSWGVTAFHDATATNGPRDFDAFRRLQAKGLLKQRVVVMSDARHLDDWTASGLRFGSGEARLRTGHAKIILDEVEGTVRPPPRELVELVQGAYRRGFPVAIHCATAETAYAAVAALEAARPLRPRPLGIPDRLEHGSLLPPALDAALARLSVAVVTNPAFLWHSGGRYRAEVSRGDRRMLYRAHSLLDSGIAVAAGSDAPVAPPDPRPALYAAVTRRDATGAALGLRERVSRKQALSLFTRAARAVSPSPFLLPEGAGLADRAIWDRDLLRCPARELIEARVLRVEMDGQAVWEATSAGLA
jgi:predicted amidohydrolase YtcJ